MNYRAGVNKLLTVGLCGELALNLFAHSWAMKGSQ